ncbi:MULTISPECIES: acyl-CoA thioesterase [unclassified Shewanella]|nr:MULTISPECIES: acyl-CoA thioesterase [unclassified Shewanella]MCU8022318.1 acyl-CoA thioesterase [Shewanella sp. SM78]MCU8044778.1 acyl-CoA thioesterase [Shewanella sp. SM68]MCU8049064.1 acyl-CoA thioesterase [Shewanella sp. SM65]MCU8079609.1 acyl-CoA thioesterase [Shewanella sp. SM103]
MKSLLTIDMEMQIPFHDVDSMGITWHGNYLRYFEIARCKLLDELGYNYRQMQASNYAWPIIDLQIKYVKASTFEQKITVRAELVEWENRLKINYQIRDVETGARITKGYTIQAAVDMSTQELCFVTPEVFRDKIAPLLAKVEDQ